MDHGTEEGENGACDLQVDAVTKGKRIVRTLLNR